MDVGTLLPGCQRGERAQSLQTYVSTMTVFTVLLDFPQELHNPLSCNRLS